MNISLKQLEIFVTIVECGNFTEAGRRLYLAQSTVSRFCPGRRRGGKCLTAPHL